MEIGRLPGGWLDGLGERVTPEALKQCLEFADGLEAAALPAPRVYPTADGGISLEWSEGAREVQAEVISTGNIIFGMSDTASEATAEILLSDLDGSLDEGIGWLRQHLGSDR